MKHGRFPIAALMAIVAAIALNLAVIRSFDQTRPDSLSHLFFACGVMPMASILFLVALFSAPSLLRGGPLSPFALGFEVFGATAAFAFVTIYSIAPRALMAYTDWTGQWTRPVLLPLFRSSPDWVQLTVELGAAAVLFSVPEAVIALFGGWLNWQLGLTTRFERMRAKQPAAAIPSNGIVPEPALLECRVSS